MLDGMWVPSCKALAVGQFNAMIYTELMLNRKKMKCRGFLKYKIASNLLYSAEEPQLLSC